MLASAILDITVDCADARAQAELWAAAAVVASQPPGVSWIVLADPEGNEFCLEG